MLLENVQKDETRFTVIIPVAQHEQLKQMAKKYKITQPEVLTVLIDHMKEEEIAADLAKIREDKIRTRGLAKDSSLFIKFSKLTAEQIAMLEKI